MAEQGNVDGPAELRADSTTQGAIRRGLLCVAGLGIVALGVWPSGPLAFLPITLALGIAAGLGLPWVVEAAAPRLMGRLQGVKLRQAAEGVGLVLVFATFLLLKVIGIRASTTDENIYFYMAQRFAEGVIPYRDFFFAHPPMHLVIPAGVFLITAFNLVAAKLIPVAAALVSGLFLYLALRRIAGRSAALAGLAGFLSAYQVLMASTNLTGVNLTLAFLCTALYFAVSDRPAAAGALAALSMATGFYALAGVLGLALALLFHAPKKLLWFAVAFCIMFGAVMGLFWMLGGSDFIEGVVTYHVNKPVQGIGRVDPFTSRNPFVFLGRLLNNAGVFVEGKTFLEFFYFHMPFFLCMAVAPAAVLLYAAWSGWRESGAAAWRVLSPCDLLNSRAGLIKFSLITIGLFVFQWANLREVYDFYLVLMAPFLVIPLGILIGFAYQRVQAGLGLRNVVVAFGTLAILWLHVPLSPAVSHALWLSEEQGKGQVVTYTWQEPAAFRRAASITRTVFFRDSRIKGEYTPYYRHYMWNKMLTFSTVHEIASYIAANTEPEETLTGASILAPLIALYAGRRLAWDEADTNYKRFASGQRDQQEFFVDVCADRLKYVVSAERSFFKTAFMTRDPFARKAFVLEKAFRDDKARHFRPMAVRLYRVREPGCGLFEE